MKNIAIFLDGTWNDPEDKTNVHTLEQKLVCPMNGKGTEQIAHYVKGVGVAAGTQIRGGAFGFGLSSNILEAYDWLVDNYAPTDKLFLFGFSRGAYTVRSLAGMIARCGLLSKGSSITSNSLFDRYKRGKEEKRLDELTHMQLHNERALTSGELELIENSHRVDIEMLGVWDTVGALGIPWSAAPIFGPKDYYFHNTNPSTLYQNCFQALALDEHRGAYSPTLWTDFVPDQLNPDSYERRDRRNFEQRWFIGAHANVGGGYASDPLRNIPLSWLQQKAENLGLEFTGPTAMSGMELSTKPTDSFAEFMHGLYRIARLGKRFYRKVGKGPVKVSKGWSIPINEAIDASVIARWQHDKEYRPKNLTDWADRKKVALGQISGDQFL